MTSIFYQRGQLLEQVRAGGTFRKVRKDRMVESTEIKSVYADPAGVPHVKFAFEMCRPQCPAYKEGPRILSLPVFVKTHDERVVRNSPGVHSTSIRAGATAGSWNRMGSWCRAAGAHAPVAPRRARARQTALTLRIEPYRVAAS